MPPVVTAPPVASCPKCGSNKKNKKLNCCGVGGSWFNQCGNPGDKRYKYTWEDGLRACKGKFTSHKHLIKKVEKYTLEGKK